MAVEIGKRAGLAEMLDAERARAVAVDRAKPGESCRMAVENGDQRAAGRHVVQQTLDVRAGVHQAALACTLRRGPAGVQSVSGGHGHEADVAAVLGHQAHRLDRLRHHRPGIGDDDLAVRTGRALPIGAVDDRLA